MSVNCFIDTETTSLHPGTGEIWEFACIRVEEDGTEKKDQFFIEVDNLGDADLFSLNIGRFHDRFNSVLALDKYQAARRIERLTRGAVLWGNTVSFDAHRLDNLLRGYNRLPSWDYHIADVEAVAYGYIKGVQEWGGPFFSGEESLPSIPPPPWSAKIVNEYLQVERPSPEEEHTAMGDALYTQRLHDAIFNPA